MRKTLLEYNPQGDPTAGWHQQLALPGDEGKRDEWAMDAARLLFARHVVHELDEAGYTAHPDTVLDLLEHLPGHHAPELHFPPYRPVPGTDLVLVGGPAHGEVRKVGVDPLASIRAAGERWEQAHLYEFAGLNVATGAWEWTDGGLA